MRNISAARNDVTARRLRGCTKMDEERPFVIESPTRIRLGPDARFWAEQHGLSLEEMAKFLLTKEKKVEKANVAPLL
jgi:hypothetical protein